MLVGLKRIDNILFGHLLTEKFRVPLFKKYFTLLKIVSILKYLVL